MQTILLIEPNPFLRLMICDRLTSDGFTMRSAQDAIQAVQLAKTQAFDLILYGSHSFGLHPTTLRDLQAEPSTSHIPCATLTLQDCSDLSQFIELALNRYQKSVL
jgi:CheY-like chemotaxis protein